MIVTLGNFATKLLLDTKDGITKLRGQEFPFSRAGVDATLLPTFHPSAVLRSGGKALAESRADFVRVKRALATTSRVLHGPDEVPDRLRRTDARGRGRARASCSVAGDLVLLVGDLGAGKTAFAQGLAAASASRSR